ncbi:hypothetical protein ACSDR0_34065, partial [Streptosporangium sp. G11]
MGRQLDFLEHRHRVHARVEDRIRTGKSAGLGHLPSKSMQVNAAWCAAAALASNRQDLWIKSFRQLRMEPGHRVVRRVCR